MNNSTNLKIIPFITEDQYFEPLDKMVNSPKQQMRREAKRRMVRRSILREKALHLAGAFSAGAVFIWLLMQFA